MSDERKLRFFIRGATTDDVAVYCGDTFEAAVIAAQHIIRCEFGELARDRNDFAAVDVSLEVKRMTDDEVASLPEM